MFDALKSNPVDYLKMLFGINNDTAYFNTTYYDNMRFWYSEDSTNIFSDSHTIIRLNAFVQLFSFGHFHVHNVFINFVSLLGLTAFFKAARNFLPQSKKLVFYVLFLVPSVLFWGSGLLKESIILFSLGMLLYHLQKFSNELSIKSLLMILISIVLISYTKLYVLIALIPGLLGYLISTKLLKQKTWLSYVISFVFFSVICLLLKDAPLKMNPIQLIIAKQHDFIVLLNEVGGSSSFQINNFKNLTDILIYTPTALMNTFVRPFLWEINSPFMLMSTIENLDIITLFIIAFIFRKSKPNLRLIYFCLAYVLCIYLLVGLTVPNFGAIARYKVPAIPFLLMAFVFIIDIEKIRVKHPFLNRFL